MTNVERADDSDGIVRCVFAKTDASPPSRFRPDDSDGIVRCVFEALRRAFFKITGFEDEAG
jgi:hypothetical protein